jgi:hypothetical protein
MAMGAIGGAGAGFIDTSKMKNRANVEAVNEVVQDMSQDSQFSKMFEIMGQNRTTQRFDSAELEGTGAAARTTLPRGGGSPEIVYGEEVLNSKKSKSEKKIFIAKMIANEGDAATAGIGGNKAKQTFSKSAADKMTTTNKAGDTTAKGSGSGGGVTSVDEARSFFLDGKAGSWMAKKESGQAVDSSEITAQEALANVEAEYNRPLAEIMQAPSYKGLPTGDVTTRGLTTLSQLGLVTDTFAQEGDQLLNQLVGGAKGSAKSQAVGGQYNKTTTGKVSAEALNNFDGVSAKKPPPQVMAG